MQVNKLLFFLGKIYEQRAESPYAGDRDGLPVIIDAIDQAIKFKVEDEGVDPTVEQLNDAAKTLNLPYQKCYFESSNTAVLAVEKGEFIMVQIFCKVRKGAWYVIPPKMCIAIEKETAHIVSLNDDPEARDLMARANADEDIRTMIGVSTGFLVRTLMTLNCSNVTTKDHPFSKMINKKRIRKGKLPFYEYKTLHIKPSEKNTSCRTKASSDRHGPRVHLRRGHIRNLKTQSIWVQPCVVGNKKNGMIHKDYSVTGG